MLEMHAALAGVVLNGAIYAVGGYNNHQHLRSAERFDPREPNWRMLPMMNTTRCVHTLAVLDEKIYSIGGYVHEDRATVATIEFFDPRMPSWVTVQPMNYTGGAILQLCLVVRYSRSVGSNGIGRSIRGNLDRKW